MPITPLNNSSALFSLFPRRDYNYVYVTPEIQSAKDRVESTDHASVTRIYERERRGRETIASSSSAAAADEVGCSHGQDKNMRKSEE